MKSTVFKNQLKVARIFFILSALYGLYIRFSMVVSLPIQYKYTLEAHSHIAFLGWGFLAVISLIGIVFYPKILQTSKRLQKLFLVMAISLVGMLISFTLQGYKLFSIAFLVIFLLISYVYLIQVFKIIKSDKSSSAKFIKTGIFYYFLSSIAVWIVPIILSKFGKTDLYHNVIYFYLHFLYNGFFVFTLFGMLVKHLENQQIMIGDKYIKNFYIFTHIACIPAYSLSLLWSDMPYFVRYVGFVTAALQLASLFYLFKIQKIFLKTTTSKFVRFLSIFIITSYFIKILMQFLSVFPSIITKAVQLKSYFIIGYLHLFTLAFMSLFIILLMLIHPKVKLNKTGISLLMLGIFLSEFFLFVQGLLVLFFKGITEINWVLFIVSILMPLGLLIIHFSHKPSNRTSVN